MGHKNKTQNKGKAARVLTSLKVCNCGTIQKLPFGVNTAIELKTVTNTNLLPACSRVLLEKLTGSQLVKKFPAFYGSRMFITAFTTARHLYLSYARSIQSMPPLPEYPS